MNIHSKVPVVKLPVKEAYVHTRRIDPTGTCGESVTSENVIASLKGIYDRVYVLCQDSGSSKSFFDFALDRRVPRFSDFADHHVINYPYAAAFRDTGLLHCLMKGQRVFFYRIEQPYDNFSSRVKRFLSNLLAVTTSKLLTTSRVLYDASAWTSRVAYLPTPISPEFFSPSHQEKRLDNQLIYLGNLNSRRFPMEYMKLVFKVISNAGGKMEIITSCSVENRVYADFIKKYCLRRGFKKQINIRVRNLTINEKIHAYRTSSAFIFPSLSPSAIDPPVTVLEAMASGCIVISTDLLSLPYILGNERGIVLHNKRLDSELEEAVLRVLFGSDFSKAIREKAVDYARRRHTVESAAEIIRRLCREQDDMSSAQNNLD